MRNSFSDKSSNGLELLTLSTKGIEIEESGDDLNSERVNQPAIPLLRDSQISPNTEINGSDWQHFDSLLTELEYRVEPNIIVFLDETISLSSLRELSERLEKYSIPQDQFVDYIINFAYGLQDCQDRFQLGMPTINLADSDRAYYHAGEQAISLGLGVIANSLANRGTFHIAAYSLRFQEDAYFTAWEEGTHYSQIYAEAQAKGVSQEDLVKTRIDAQSLFNQNSNYAAIDPYEVFAGFVLREEFRKSYPDEMSAKLTYQQDLYVLDQIKRTGIKFDGWTEQMIASKKRELADIVAAGGRFPDLEPAGLEKAERGAAAFLAYVKFAMSLMPHLKAYIDKFDRFVEAMSETRIFRPFFRAAKRFSQFQEKMEKNFEDWITRKLRKKDEDNN